MKEIYSNLLVVLSLKIKGIIITNFLKYISIRKKKEIVGTDSKSFLNDESFKINKKNNPRIFANTVSVKKNESVFDKSIFTLCQYRKNDKSPPWTIQSKK